MKNKKQDSKLSVHIKGKGDADIQTKKLLLAL
jgi:hypothetical protein